MENKTNIKNINQNLLTDKEYKAALQFESEYATLVKGGHYPYYFLKKSN